MLNPRVSAFVETVADELRKENPALLARLSDFELKAEVLDKTRNIANEQADSLVELHQTAQLVKCLRQLIEVQP